MRGGVMRQIGARKRLLVCASILAGVLVVGLAQATVPNNITQAFITGGNSTVGVTSDLTHVYWANNGDGTIGRANIDGTNVNQAFITGASGPITVAVDANFIYWVNQNNGTIGRAGINGTGGGSYRVRNDRRPRIPRPSATCERPHQC